MTLRFKKINENTWRAIREGTKKVETRAGSPKYLKIKRGDTLIFVCGKKKFSKNVAEIRKFKSVRSLLKKYKPQEINPGIKDLEATEKIYYSYPGYREKIRKFGIIALELRN